MENGKLAALIANPAARKSSRKKVDRAAKLLNKYGYRVITYYTCRSGHGTELAARAAADGASVVIACGGDGTYNEVMNGLLGRGVPMAILPTGTTNVLAKELGFPETVGRAVKRIAKAKPRDVFVGRMEFPDGTVRRFFLMAGIGFDAAAVYAVSKKMKAWSGKSAYFWSGLKTLLKWRPALIPVKLEGAEYGASGLIVCKGASYGGYVKAAPDARLTEPYLYAVVMLGYGRVDILRYAFGMALGRYTKFSDVVYKRCRQVEVAGRARLQADGDYIGETPVRITVEPEPVKLLW